MQAPARGDQGDGGAKASPADNKSEEGAADKKREEEKRVQGGDAMFQQAKLKSACMNSVMSELDKGSLKPKNAATHDQKSFDPL